MSRSDVTVKRPDPQTGEVLEEVVPANHFGPQLPGPPRFDVVRYFSFDGAGRVGWQWLCAHDYRERMLAYWVAHAHHLTRDERFRIASGYASIVRPIEVDWEPGCSFDVEQKLSVEVIETKWVGRERGKGFPDEKFRTTFLVHDFRDVFLRRGAGYTTSRAQAVDDAGIVLDERAVRRIHGEKAMRDVHNREQAAQRTAKLRSEQALMEAHRRGKKGRARFHKRMTDHHGGEGRAA